MSPEEVVVVRRLGRPDRPALERHFLALEPEDRRLRFGVALGDAALAAYVADIDLDADAAFGVDDERLELVGVAHLVRRARLAELGLSVRASRRGYGVGQALLRRAHTHARNAGMPLLYMHCLRENAAMMHLARKEGLRVMPGGGEADALLRLAPADAASHLDEALADGVAVFDLALKTQWNGMRRFASSLLASSLIGGRPRPAS